MSNFNIGDKVIFRNDFSLSCSSRILECIRNKNENIVAYTIMTTNSELSIIKENVIRKALNK